MSTSAAYHVRAAACDYRASDAEVYETLQRVTAPLSASWDKIRAARRITIKFNQVFPPQRRQMMGPYLQELVDTRVARATLRLLREANPSAEILCPETSPEALYDHVPMEDNVAHIPLLEEFGVKLLRADEPPHKIVEAPGGGAMFQRYLMHEAVAEHDAFVSVAKMKNHAFMGITLCLKNLFGLPPMQPLGRSRPYFHHIIRLSHVLVDLGRITNPTLNIVDGMVAQAGREWGGQGRIANTLLAGDQVTATDACGAHLMGFDPLGDWPHQPFVRDRSAIRIAHDAGFGTADLSQIDFESEVQAPVAEFRTVETDTAEMVRAWRRTTCEQALYYRDHQKSFIEQYAGQYILLQDNEVRWHDTSSDIWRSRRELAGARKESALWFKLVDPEEREGERFEVYERELARMAG